MKNSRAKLFQQLRYLCLAGVCVFGLITIIASSGGSDEEDGPPVDTSLPLSLTSSNALGVTGLTLDAAEGGITAGSIPVGVISSANAPDSSTFDVNVLRIAQVAFRSLLEASQIVTPSVWGRTAWPPDQSDVSCTSGGVVNIDHDDADANNIVSKDDSATFDYSNCGELGLTLNGGLMIVVTRLTGDPSGMPPWGVTLRLFFTTLTATDGGGSVIRVVGDIDVAIDASGTRVVTDVTTEITPFPSFLQFEEGGDFIRLTDFTVVLDEASPGGDFTVSTRGTLESTLIGGTITFLPLVLLEGTDFDNNNPDVGELEITGATSSKIRLEVLSATNVRLHVDADGDGNYDPPPIDTTWNAIEAAADVL